MDIEEERSEQDRRIDALIDAALAALGEAAAEHDASVPEMFMAATSLSVRLALVGCKSHADAKAAVEYLTSDYLSQAQTH